MLHRVFTDWEWYQDGNVSRVFIHCLLRANTEDKMWRGILIKKGSFISSYAKLSAEIGLSPKIIRTSINKLIRTNELAHQSTTKYSTISIVKWEHYQKKGKQTGKQTGSQRANRGQTEGNKQESKESKEEEESIEKINKKENQEYSDNFSEFWHAYPSSDGKKSTSNAYEKIIKSKKVDHEQLLKAATNHAQQIRSGEKNYPFAGYNFINQDHWQDYLEYTPKKKPVNYGKRNDKQSEMRDIFNDMRKREGLVGSGDDEPGMKDITPKGKTR